MTYRYHHHPLLGTDVALAIDGVGPDVADALDAAAVTEIVRLERMLTAFDPSSELECWKRGEVETPSDELAAVLVAALDWQIRSGGAFNPLVDEIARLWREAETTGVTPASDALARAAAQISEPRVLVEDGRITAAGDVGRLRLHAFAKGWIVDRAIDASIGSVDIETPDLDLDIVVNAGGDLAHRGRSGQTIAIANPLSRFDNAPPVDRVQIRNSGLATSGRSRQGFDIGGQHYSHVIDPRTGRPVDEHASISVVAPDAASADAIATIAGVLSTDAALEVADSYDSACLVVGLDGRLRSNARWDELRVETVQPAGSPAAT